MLLLGNECIDSFDAFFVNIGIPLVVIFETEWVMFYVSSPSVVGVFTEE